MKRLLLLLALVLAGPPAGAADMLEAFDIPVMAGLDLEPEQSLMFDSPEGRVAEAVLSGPRDPAAVRRFYEASLPMLGWQPQPAENTGDSQRLLYWRADERLELHIDPLDGGTRLRLTLTPD